MAYSAVGPPAEITGGGSANVSSAALSVSPTALGDVLVLFAGSVGYHNTAHTDLSTNDQPVSSVSGGGVTTWNKLVAQGVGTNHGTDSEVWWGVITSTGSQTITVDWASSVTYVVLVAQQFHSSVAATWSAGTPSLEATAAYTLESFTSLSASVAGGIYVAARANFSINASTYTFSNGAIANYPGSGTIGSVIYAYNLSPGTSSQSPSWNAQETSTYTDGQVAAFLYCVTPAVLPSNRIYTQAVRRSYTWFKDVVFDRTPRGLLVPKVA